MMARLAALISILFLVALPAAAADELTVHAGVLRVEGGGEGEAKRLPLSRLDMPAEDDGFAGARLATTDNTTTGQFLGHVYETDEVTTTPEEAEAELDALIE